MSRPKGQRIPATPATHANGRFIKGHPGIPGVGRPKGSLNRFTTVKQAFLEALEEMGGKDFIINVCKTEKGKHVFLTNISKLLPHDSKITINKPISDMSDEELLELREAINGRQRHDEE